MNYLLLAHGQLIRIQISLLDACKEKLARSSIIAVGPGVDDLEAEPAQMVLDLLTLVVAGAVEKQYGLLPEVGPVPL